MPTSEVQYRYGRPDDAKAIASLGLHVFNTSFAHLMPATDLKNYLLEAYSASNITTALESPSTTFVVAIKDDSIVAFLQLAQGASEACIDDVESKIHLQRLYVRETCQGMGIGKELMARAEMEGRKLGAENIWLASWEKNPKASRIYEKAGYVTVGSMKFMLGDAELKDWVMIKSL